jgi:hypothetical protein
MGRPLMIKGLAGKTEKQQVGAGCGNRATSDKEVAQRAVV